MLKMHKRQFFFGHQIIIKKGTGTCLKKLRQLVISALQRKKEHLNGQISSWFKKECGGRYASFSGTAVYIPLRKIIIGSSRWSVFTQLLVACTRLYKPLCRSVGPSVCRSVGRSVGLSVRHPLLFFAFLSYLKAEQLIFSYHISFGT